MRRTNKSKNRTAGESVGRAIFSAFFSTQTSSNMLFVKRTDLLNKAKLKQVKETHFGVTL